MLLLITLLASTAVAVLVPGPPGPYKVSYSAHDLTDQAREEIFAPPGSPPLQRRIMASVFLPIDADACPSTQLIPYMPPKTTEAYGEYANGYGLPADLFVGYELEFCDATEEATTTYEATKYPLVIFSPGLTASRLLYSAQARALASYGYAVVTVDHPYDATIVEFNDGTYVDATLPSPVNDTLAEIAVEVRSKDVSFIIDLLQAQSCLTADSSFPQSIKSSIDTTQIIAYGHSLGGATAAAAVYSDDRILGGMDVDGSLYGPVIAAGLDRPFIMTSRSPPGSNVTDRPPWDDFYDNLRGPKAQLAITGTTHYSYIDARLLFTTQEIPDDLVPIVEALTGVVEGGRLESIFQGILAGLADLILRDDPEALLSIDETFSEVVIREEHLVVA